MSIRLNPVGVKYYRVSNIKGKTLRPTRVTFPPHAPASFQLVEISNEQFETAKNYPLLIEHKVKIIFFLYAVLNRYYLYPQVIDLRERGEIGYSKNNQIKTGTFGAFWKADDYVARKIVAIYTAKKDMMTVLKTGLPPTEKADYIVLKYKL